MSAADLEGGAARRRRQRQLRAFHFHVQMAVKLELATALHHSAQRVEGPKEVEVHEKHDGLRAEKRPLPGRGRRLLRRLPGRRCEQAWSVTCLPRFLGWRAIVSKEMMASTALPSGSSFARCWRRRRGGRRRRRRRRRTPRLPRRPRGRGKRGGSVDFLVVCGYDAVGKGSALARRCLVRSIPFLCRQA